MLSIPLDASPRVYRALIVDDERIARVGLSVMLASEPLMTVAGEAATCRDAIAMIRALRPDVVFLDIAMQSGSGFDVVRAFEPGERPAVVFVTAHSTYALEAFGVRAVDYLLKPFHRSDLADTVQWVVRHLRGDVPARSPAGGLRRTVPGAVERIGVRNAGVLEFIDISAIDRIEVQGNNLQLFASGRQVLTRRTLGALMASLPASQFLRISRSIVLNLSSVESIRRERGGLFLFQMRDGTEWRSSRRYRRDVLAAVSPV